MMDIHLSLEDYFEMPNWYVESILLFIGVKAEYDESQKGEEG